MTSLISIQILVGPTSFKNKYSKLNLEIRDIEIVRFVNFLQFLKTPLLHKYPAK